jgi:hypothetical protein
LSRRIRSSASREVVTVVPVTHAKPSNPTDAIEIPGAVKVHLGLDDSQSWIVVIEVNDFCGRGPTCCPFREQSRLRSNSECCRRAFSRTYATEFFKRIAIASWTTSPVPNDNRKKPLITAVDTRPAAYRHRCAPGGSGNGRRGLAARPGARAIEAPRLHWRCSLFRSSACGGVIVTCATALPFANASIQDTATLPGFDAW